jgi:drug/metabolite transporter (DMT)-like permease
MSNVLILKTSRVLPDMKPEMRTATIFGGAALFSACASLFEAMPTPPTGAHLGTAAWLVLGLGFLLASNNMLVQYGLARVPANRASIIMLFEIVVTALSAWLFAGETPGPREWAGGVCIVLASALSSWVHRTKAMPPDPAIQEESLADGRDAGLDDRKDGKNRSRAMV